MREEVECTTEWRPFIDPKVVEVRCDHGRQKYAYKYWQLVPTASSHLCRCRKLRLFLV